MSKLKKNLGYQTVYQLLNTCLPLITSPYLARVLGATQQGVFSYTQSIANYFTLFAMLGVANHGTRTIAICGDDRKSRSISFWNIYAVQFIASVLALAVYGSYLCLLCKENLLIAWIQGLYILGSLLDINWLFFGVEQFETTVKRSMVIRLASFAAILLLVNSPQDLWIYAVIMAGGTALSNGVLWYFLPGVVDWAGIKEIRRQRIQKQLKPVAVLFVPLLAMSVYHIMDKTMLGFLSSYEQTGFYYNADKIINIPISIITGIGTVMLPRMSALADSKNKNESELLFNTSFELITLLSAAMTFGIAAVAAEFVPIFFGDGFEPCIPLIIVLSPVLIIKSISQTARMQYLIPNHLEKIFIQSVFAGAVVNFIINSYMIVRCGALGAVIGTLAAELVTCVWQYWKIRKRISLSRTMLRSAGYIVLGLVMFIVVRLSANVLPDGVPGILAEVCIGGMTYLILCVVFWIISKNPLLKILKKHR